VSDLRTTPLSQIRVGQRLRSTLPGKHNQAIVTALTDSGFLYRIPDDEEVLHPHWSMSLARDGHEAFTIRGEVFWEAV